MLLYYCFMLFFTQFLARTYRGARTNLCNQPTKILLFFGRKKYYALFFQISARNTLFSEEK